MNRYRLAHLLMWAVPILALAGCLAWALTVFQAWPLLLYGGGFILGLVATIGLVIGYSALGDWLDQKARDYGREHGPKF